MRDMQTLGGGGGRETGWGSGGGNCRIRGHWKVGLFASYSVTIQRCSGDLAVCSCNNLHARDNLLSQEELASQNLAPIAEKLTDM